MSNSRFSTTQPRPPRGQRKGPDWTMQRAKMVLEESPTPEKHGYRDSAYHWLLDRIERQEASPKEKKEIRDLFVKAGRGGDLQAREKVRGRYERIFANV